MNERIGYPEYILNETALLEEYVYISLSNDSFLGSIIFLMSLMIILKLFA